MEEMAGDIAPRPPLVDPDCKSSSFRSRLSEAFAGNLLGKAKLIVLLISDGEVSKIYIAHCPTRRILSDGFRCDSATKEGELIPVAVLIGAQEVACVIPPFGLELLMAAKVPGKAVHIAGKSRTKSMFRCRKSGDRKESQQSTGCKEDRRKDDPPKSDRLEE